MLLHEQLAFSIFKFLFLFHLFLGNLNLELNTLNSADFPLIVSTWDTSDFQAAAQKAFDVFQHGSMGRCTSSSCRRLNAIVEGLSECEKRRCGLTVGFGGSPDERGETTLDAMVMDGSGHKTGAVAALRRVKNAAKVAWAVMNYTKHSLLAGEKATEFALAMGFESESLSTEESKEMHRNWLQGKCQPNFWKNVKPDPSSQCGPYKPNHTAADESRLSSTKYTESNGYDTEVSYDLKNHDTIGMVLIDSEGNVAAGTSSNGARNKIPGRVGDAPIVGSGAFVDNEIGGAVATGNGDVMMRFVPSFLAVEQMRSGKSPSEATREAIRRIKQFYPNFMGAVLAVNVGGKFGAACSGIMGGFGYSVVSSTQEKVWVEKVNCE